MHRTCLAFLLTIVISLSNLQLCFSRDLIKSLEVETALYNDCVRAKTLAAEGHLEQARDILLRAAQFDPSSYSGAIHNELYNLARAFHNAGKHEQAMEVLRKYIVLEKDDPGNRRLGQDYLNQLGVWVYARKGRDAQQAHHYFDAKRFLLKALEFKPEREAAEYIHAALCFVMGELGETAGSIEEGKRALAINPSNSVAMLAIGKSYSDSLNFDEAISWVQRYAAAETDPARRKYATDMIQALNDDRKQYNNPNNKEPDYYAVMRGSEDEIHRWPKERMPLKIYVDTPTAARGYKPAFNRFVVQSMDTWCQASGKKVDYKLIKNADDADIVVTWTHNPLDVSLDHPNVQPCGLTQTQTSGSGFASTATVQIRTVDPFHPDEPVEEAECAHIVLHELGHALGLGHSKYIRDIMYFRGAPKQNFSARDKSTMARVYAGYPALNFVPKQKPTEGAPVVPIAPPAFLPPEAPDDSNIQPPMFVPPPVTAEDTLTPPMFVPNMKEDTTQVPMFIPAPVNAKPAATKKPTPVKPGVKKKEDVVVPMFTPPPLK